MIVTVVSRIPLKISYQEIMCRAGITKPSVLPENIHKLIHTLLKEVNQNQLIDPKISFSIISVTLHKENYLKLKMRALHGRIFANYLFNAENLALAVATIGSELEKKAYTYRSSGYFLRGTLLDCIGTSYIDSLKDECRQIIKNRLELDTKEISSPFSPGSKDFPMAEQSKICELTEAEKIGVEITGEYMILPRKSVSMVFGIGRNMPRWTKRQQCLSCPIKDTCQYKFI